MEKYLRVNRIERVTQYGEVEEIFFEDGVNVISGDTGAGKTVWLMQLDYVLGRDKTLQEIFSDPELANKYVSLAADIEIRGEELTISRQPFKSGYQSKIFLNEKPLSITEFSREIFEKLGYPTELKYPKGNPYYSSWNELTFRSLYRHIFRREDHWSDIVDRQPDKERFACQYLILGIAEKIFSDEYDSSINHQKELAKLEARRDEYKVVLDQIAQEMVPKAEEKQLHYANENEINIRIVNLENDLSELEQMRNSIIHEKIKKKKEENEIKIIELASEKAKLTTQLERNLIEIQNIAERKGAFESLSESILDELNKLSRTKRSGVLSDLKVTHCPACDQELPNMRANASDECFLCYQKLPIGSLISDERIDFELKQLKAENLEIKELIGKLNNDLESWQYRKKSIKEKIEYLEREIAPLRETYFAFMNEDISDIDVKRGRLQEQIQNYRRLLSNIQNKDSFNKAIQDIEKKIAEEKELVEKATREIDFSTIADDLADGMNFYVKEIHKINPDRWNKKGEINVAINENRIAFYVDNKPWDSLSALDKGIFLISYNFGLLTLSFRRNYRFPGFVVIDFERSLVEAKKGGYNYLIEPFVKWCDAMKSKKNVQVIFAGRTFEGLTGVNEIHLEDYIVLDQSE